MNIAYLLEDTHLAGGIRVAAAQADALIARGHHVTLITTGSPLTWRESRAKWIYVDSLDAVDAKPFDFVVGTFWKTIRGAFALAGERTIHLCQGYEGSFTAYRDLKSDIDAVYRLPIPKITVSPHLVDICRRFYDDATYVGQIVDADFYQTPTSHAGQRVLLVGPFQADFKGIDVGYAAVRHARRQGARFDLIRVSQWPPADGEPVGEATEFYEGLDTRAMANLVASCDVFLGPSREPEGFGLPAAEAMASGLPAMLSAISSFTSWDPKRDYALFAGNGDAVAMGDALIRLLSDAVLRNKLATRGRAVVEQFRAERTAERLEHYFCERLQRR
jgi:glycosyltransferase involved in cell wall biosynthesis